jgi:hypothetical protein
LQAWSHVLTVGQPLPTLPLWLTADLVVPLDLEQSYELRASMPRFVDRVKAFVEAEPLLLSGYEGMKKREAKIPPRGKDHRTEAVERPVQLYEATGKKAEAAKWRTEREALQAAHEKTEQEKEEPPLEKAAKASLRCRALVRPGPAGRGRGAHRGEEG